jgi:predicted dienelactone hydrolase
LQFLEHSPVRTIVRRHVFRFFSCLLFLAAGYAHAEPEGMGFIQLPQPDEGRITVFFPSSDPEALVERGPFRLSLAPNGAPVKANGHLIIISHGSGGSPWVHVDLARALVQQGFTVALPQHHADNYLDPSKPGPDSWSKRPREVSTAIDVIASYPPLASHLSLDAVGVFGGSAGGHTALSMAGGEWTRQRFREHCEQNIEQDFSSCVGFLTLLKGNWLDGLKIWVAKQVIAARFSGSDTHPYADPRVKAAVAMVPYAADFLPDSLANPRIPLGLVIADKDINQVPKFHAEAVLQACAPRCEIVMRLPDAGHGAMLSPMPPLVRGSVADRLLSDPPGFDRATAVPELNRRITDFFIRRLLASAKG